MYVRRPKTIIRKTTSYKGGTSLAEQGRLFGPELMEAINMVACTRKGCNALPMRRCHNGYGVPAPFHKVRVEAGRKKLADAAPG